MNKSIRLPSHRGGFRVLYVDPPWKYSNKRTRSAAAKNYAVMTLADLKALPVQKVAAKNCALFLWATCPFLPEALEIAAAWGFTYKTVAFSWSKKNTDSDTPFFGMGNWTRANVELCLLFVRGNPKRKKADVAQFIWSKILRHSEKPAFVRDRIVRLMGDVSRLEMFARHRTPGWRTWGNEVLP